MGHECRMKKYSKGTSIFKNKSYRIIEGTNNNKIIPKQPRSHEISQIHITVSQSNLTTQDVSGSSN